MDRTYKGLRVLGGDVVVHRVPGGAELSRSQTLSRGLPAAVQPSISADQAKRTGMEAARVRGNTQGELRQDGRPEPVVDARQGEPRLAYLTRTAGEQADGTPSLVETTVDAKTGEVLLTEQKIQTDIGTGKSLYD